MTKEKAAAGDINAPDVEFGMAVGDFVRGIDQLQILLIHLVLRPTMTTHGP